MLAIETFMVYRMYPPPRNALGSVKLSGQIGRYVKEKIRKIRIAIAEAVADK